MALISQLIHDFGAGLEEAPETMPTDPSSGSIPRINVLNGESSTASYERSDMREAHVDNEMNL